MTMRPPPLLLTAVALCRHDVTTLSVYCTLQDSRALPRQEALRAQQAFAARKAAAAEAEGAAAAAAEASSAPFLHAAVADPRVPRPVSPGPSSSCDPESKVHASTYSQMTAIKPSPHCTTLSAAIRPSLDSQGVLGQCQAIDQRQQSGSSCQPHKQLHRRRQRPCWTVNQTQRPRLNRQQSHSVQSPPSQRQR